MWVSRDRWNRLENRLAVLEAWKRESIHDTHFSVHEPIALEHWRLSMSYPVPHAKISVQDVVRQILDKLSIKLTYVKGHPDRVDIVTTAPSSNAAGESEPK